LTQEEIKKDKKVDEIMECMVCGRKSMHNSVVEIELPYFGKCLLTTLMCDECGFRHNDIFVLEVNSPVKYELRIDSEEDMSIRVARSNSCTILIPELGLTVEPAGNSIAYISNVEGVLERFEEVVGTMIRSADDSTVSKGKEILKKIEDAKRGKEIITLILKDPLGNSIIDSGKAVKTGMSHEEAESLSGGLEIYDKG